MSVPSGRGRGGPSLAPAALGALSAATVLHTLPALVGLRGARCRILPALAGIGRSDHVALTFDDGPDPTSTPAVLDALDELGWKATFFFLGDQVERHPRLCAEVVRRGHEPAVHGYTHRNQLLRPATSTVGDLRRARALVEGATGCPVTWFRPPYGAVSASTLVATRLVGLRLVLWSTWGVDWEAASTPASVAASVRGTFVPGATVLLHDSDHHSAPGSWRSALGALAPLARWWEDCGLRVGPLGEHGLTAEGR